jgi:O-antigen/teichoic acid export membrane protein
LFALFFWNEFNGYFCSIPKTSSLSLYKNLFKQTLIYGLATVLPRMISFLLNPLYVNELPKQEFADVSIVFAWLVFFNVILSYGMETAFFRFYNTEDDKQKVISTATVSIFWTSIAFLGLALLFRNTLSQWSAIKVEYVTYTIWILVLDALAIIPFSRIRANKRPIMYAIVKIGNVMINMLLNLFFLLLLPQLAQSNPDEF